MEALTPRVLVDGLVFPEGPRWHDGRLWFSDILGGKVYAFDPATAQASAVAQVPGGPSGLGFLPDGRLLIAAMRSRRLLRLDPEGLTTVADLSGITVRLNDMVVDRLGRAYLDVFFAEASGGIALVEPDGRCRVVADGMVSPNGLAVSADGSVLVANDLYGGKVLAFDIAPDGGLAGRRVFADLGRASPDGLCLDAEGAAWIGLPFEGCFRRIRPGGEVTHEISHPDTWALAPILGGPDRRTLFLCTAQVTLTEIGRLLRAPEGADGDCRGWIETVGDVAVAGAGRP